MVATIYKNIFSKEPYYKHIKELLDRIKLGSSRQKIDEIRSTIDKERANKLKCNLPSVCFSGKFGKNRTDDSIIEHSGFIVLDFDNLENLEAEKESIKANQYTYACWVSPSGNGLKALVKIADGNKHREHFKALQYEYKGVDNSGINHSRVCYESFDPEIYINEKSKIFKKTIKEERLKEDVVLTDNSLVFKNILKWLSNKGDAFVKGERNVFIFKLASACCRFGINETECISYANLTLSDSYFSTNELERTVKSAYKSNSNHFGTAEFVNERLVSKINKGEIETKDINPDIYNVDVKPKDVIFGEDVKKEALNIYDDGYKHIEGVGIPELDFHWKMKKGEISLLTGIGNYGKSSFLKWYLLLRILIFKEKFGFFAPEDNPAEEFYHDMVEIYFGCDCTPDNPKRPSRNTYEKIYDLISKHCFFVYPKEIAPTPDYIKERFLELIIKEKVSGCIIDPFNQMDNDYNGKGGRSDKYLETFLSDCSRFAQTNNVYFLIVAHPKLMRKDATGSYPCPDVFDVADGAMWNNKMDNILVYHRPDHQTNPNDSACEFHSKKIRRQKIVGRKGTVSFDLNRPSRRFYFKGVDYLERILEKENKPKHESIVPNLEFDNKLYHTIDDEWNVSQREKAPF